jgi:hypothetical protein
MRAKRDAFLPGVALCVLVAAVAPVAFLGCQGRKASIDARDAGGAVPFDATAAIDAAGCDAEQTELVDAIEGPVSAIEHGLERVEQAASPAERLDETRRLPDPGGALFESLKRLKDSMEAKRPCEPLARRLLALRERFGRALQQRSAIMQDAGAGDGSP